MIRCRNTMSASNHDDIDDIDFEPVLTATKTFKSTAILCDSDKLLLLLQLQ
jgi:hypothetical protein